MMVTENHAINDSEMESVNGGIFDDWSEMRSDYGGKMLNNGVSLYYCDDCPFFCKSFSEMKAHLKKVGHLSYHTGR